MKNQDVFAIDLYDLAAVCLIRWKAILIAALAAAALVVGFSAWSFRAPDPMEYQTIRLAIEELDAMRTQLASAEQELEEDLFHAMDPEQIKTKRLTILVELEEESQITDTADPTDLVIYAYHNLARSDLQGPVLVPGVLTKLQQEQLLTISYDADRNMLYATMTGDDEPLTDTVLAACAQWYRDRQPEITAQTRPHRLTVLPVSNLDHTRQDREDMVSPLTDEAAIRRLELRIAEYSQELDLLMKKPQNWSLSRSAESLEKALEARQRREARPRLMMPGISGFLLGGMLAALWVCMPCLRDGRLLGAEGLAAVAEWPCIGRLNAIRVPGMGPVRRGYRRLYRDADADEDRLSREARGMTALLLADRGLGRDGVVGLIGDLPQADLDRAAAVLARDGLRVHTASMAQDRVAAHRLCRSADAVIFVGRADLVTVGEAEAFWRLLAPLDKKPLGYLLV